MPTTELRMALLNGAYQGWARQPGAADWEDMIGTIKVSTVLNPDENLVHVTITSLEFGTWTGEFCRDTRVLRGATGQPNANFRLTLEQHERANGFRSAFRGGIYDAEDELLLELQLTPSI